MRAGAAHNVIPATGRLGGTVRMLDAIAWSEAEKLVPLLVEQIVAPYGIHAQVDYQRGVPPVVNDVESIVHLGDAVERVLGPGGEADPAEPGWRGLRLVPRPGARGDGPARDAHAGGPTYDLHQGNLRVDDRATGIGAKVLATVAVGSLVTER